MTDLNKTQAEIDAFFSAEPRALRDILSTPIKQETVERNEFNNCIKQLNRLKKERRESSEEYAYVLARAQFIQFAIYKARTPIGFYLD